MARLAGIDLPKQKRVDIALSYLYGIGRHLGRVICDTVGVDPATRVGGQSSHPCARPLADVRVRAAGHSGGEIISRRDRSVGGGEMARRVHRSIEADRR